MLARRNRLIGKDVVEVQGKGKIYQHNTFGIIIFNRKDDDYPRFGFVVSTKISKSAVDRNLYKRTMREAIRVNMYRLKKGYDVVFLAKPMILKTPMSEIMKEVVKAITEHNLVN